MDFLIQNLGAGPAHDVQVTADPPLRRAEEVAGLPPIAQVRYFNEPVPLMPPGYELRSYFDSVADRKEAGVDMRYTFTIAYNDGHGHSWTEQVVQDLGHLDHMLFAEDFGIHHAAKALREISTVVKKSGILTNGEVAATTETRVQRQERVRQEREDREARHALVQQRVEEARARGQQQADAAPPDPVLP